MTAVRAFIVEDSALLLRELSSVLQQTSAIRVVASSDSEGDALKTMRVASDAYDLIVIDVFLKQGSGLRVLRDAKVLQSQARLVVLTNYATSEMRKKCLELGADRVFDKSNELDELVMYCARLSEGGNSGPGALT